MKRLVLGFVVSALVLAGCGSSPSPQAKPSEPGSSGSPQATLAFASPVVLRFRVVAECGASPCIASTPGYHANAQSIASLATGTSTQVVTASAALAWAKTPPTAWKTAFAMAKCVPGVGVATVTNVPSTDDNARPLIACDNTGQKYLLSPAVMDQFDVTDAVAATSQNAAGWVVNLSLNNHGTAVFANLSTQMVTGGAYGGMDFAIVVNGRVISAPGFTGVVTNGQAQITGNFSENSASGLAQAIRFASSAHG